jgi:signal transduction histidine kinase
MTNLAFSSRLIPSVLLGLFMAEQPTPNEQKLMRLLLAERKARAELEQRLADQEQALFRCDVITQQQGVQLLAQEKLASISTLAAGLAHELNTPSGFMRCNLQLMLRHWQTIREFVERANVNPAEIAALRAELNLDYLLEDGTDLIDESLLGINHISSIVQDLRMFSEDTADLTGIVDLKDCVEQSIWALELEGAALPALHQHLMQVPRFAGDNDKITLAIMQVLNNACQAAGPSGQVWLDLQVKYVSQIVLEIRDDGPGIPQDIINRIFDPFFTTRPVGQGRGMGLAVARMIMTQHGGGIRVQTDNRLGSRFALEVLVPPLTL